ncbi:MAG: HAMP domain-containing protein [Nitrospirae bacterium]|nr:HAMP domain-containing protein [Nitrospirota bacterium]
MKLTLRKKFGLFIVLFLIVVGMLIYVLNAPYREMKSLMSDVRYDIVQIMEAEKFVRTIYEQQHEVAKLVLNGRDRSGRKEFDLLSRHAGEILGRWQTAFLSAEFTPEKRGQLNGRLNKVTETSRRIQDLSKSAVEFAETGNAPAAVRVMDMIDGSIRQELLPHADAIIKELETEVKEDLPLLFSSLQQTAVIPLLKTDIHLRDMSHELEHALQIQKISRFFSSQYLDILHVFAGSSYRFDRSQFEDFRKKIRGMLDDWTQESPDGQEEEKKKEDQREIAAIRSMVPLFDRMEKTGEAAMNRSAIKNRNGDMVSLRTELNEIDRLLSGQFDSLVVNEEHEIRKSIDAVVRVVDRGKNTIFMISVLIAAIGMLTLWFLFRNMVFPVIQLRDAALKIGKGDFTSEIRVAASDEIGDLAKSFDSMRQDLNASVNSLKDEIIVRRRAEAEKEDVIRELTNALSHIKTLNGLLPICSSCKKIRDDKGYWTQVESYVSEHTDAEFTHGYCPECAATVREEINRLKRSQ